MSMKHISIGEFYLTEKDYLVSLIGWTTDGRFLNGCVVDTPFIANELFALGSVIHGRGTYLTFNTDGSLTADILASLKDWSPGDIVSILNTPRHETRANALFYINNIRQCLTDLSLISKELPLLERGMQARFIVGHAVRSGLAGSVFTNSEMPHDAKDEIDNLISAYGIIYRICRFGWGGETIAHYTDLAVSALNTALENKR